MNRIWILTLFPQLYRPWTETGVVGKALKGERTCSLDLRPLSLADFSEKGVKGVDDAPYGGGPGMVMRPDVLRRALLEGVVKAGNYGENWREKLLVIYPSPRGKIWNSQEARGLAKTLEKRDIVLVCGRYEGVDERFLQVFVELEICLGDFVLNSADAAAWAIVESTLRFVPGVLGNAASSQEESFEGQLEHPHYTRPPEFEGLSVPSVLLSGDHQKIRNFREKESARITQEYRPDLRGRE